MDLRRIMSKCLQIVCVGMCGSFFCSLAFADDCQKLDSNNSWKKGMVTLSEQMGEKSWNDALKTAEKLNNICERSPVLNYAMGRFYREIGNDSKSLYYYQRATLFTEEFSVKGKTLEQMWFDRYEAEHPEARPASIEALKAENEQLKTRLQQSHDRAIDARFGEQDNLMAEKSRYAIGLWTGVAVAGVGLVLTGVGAGMVVANSDDSIDFSEKDRVGDEYQIHPKTKGTNNAYWGMLGAGIAATVVGATLTGLFGYWYSHTGLQDTDSAVSFYTTSNGLGIRF